MHRAYRHAMRAVCSLSALTLVALMALAGVQTARAEEVTLDARIGVVSDYRWRGVSISEEEPAAQGEASLSFASGLWAWGWASSVASEYGGSELGVGLGYTRSAGPVTWTLDAIQYFYPGEDEIDYAQVDLTLEGDVGFAWLSGGVEYVPENDNYGDDDVYLWLRMERETGGATYHAALGRDDGVMAPRPYATDYDVGVAKMFGSFEGALSVVGVDGEAAALVAGLSFLSNWGG